MQNSHQDPSQASPLTRLKLRTLIWALIPIAILSILNLGMASSPIRAEDCPPGEWMDKSVTPNVCRPAPPGHYAQWGYLFQCGWSTYQPNSGQSNCLDVDPGHYVDHAGATAQTPCSIGTYQNESRQHACKPADPGYYVPTTAATTQTSCPVGTYQNLAGQASCNACPAGTYQNMTSQAYCLPAPVGHYVAEAQSTSATECSPGSYQDEESQTECNPAPEDTYVDTYGATEPTDCPEGTLNSTSGATSASACLAPSTPTSQSSVTEEATEEIQQDTDISQDDQEPGVSNGPEAPEAKSSTPFGIVIGSSVLLIAGIGGVIWFFIRRAVIP